jgi:hypothetical protein
MANILKIIVMCNEIIIEKSNLHFF